MDGVCFYQLADLISVVSSLSDSDIRAVNLASVNVEAHSQLVEVSVSQGSVEATSAIVDVGQTLTMDVFGLCATMRHIVNVRTSATSWLYFQCATPCTQCKCSSTLARSGAQFPPETREPISMLPGTPIVFSGVPGAPHSTAGLHAS